MRVTIPRTIWGKIQTQLTKDRNVHLRGIMKGVQVTHSPAHDAILWDPPLPTLATLKVLLINEKGFMRKPDSPSYKLMGQVIAKLESLTDGVAPNVAIPPPTPTE